MGRRRTFPSVLLVRRDSPVHLSSFRLLVRPPASRDRVWFTRHMPLRPGERVIVLGRDRRVGPKALGPGSTVVAMVRGIVTRIAYRDLVEPQ